MGEETEKAEKAEKKRVSRRKKDAGQAEAQALDAGGEDQTAGGKTLETLFSELESLYDALSEEESLEKTFALYQQGLGLLKEANESIDRIEKQVKVLDDEGVL